MIPVVDVFKCNGCGTCVKQCPPQVMGLVKGKAAVLVQLCEECGICNEACAIGAIQWELPHYDTVQAAQGYAKCR